jgi:hypothetical protein
MRTIVVKRDIKDYFEDAVIPLIAREHPDVVAEMSIRVEGSVGLGLNDEFSDMEAMLFLPGDLWKEQGGQLQLTLIHRLEPFSARSHPYCECPGSPFSWMGFGHPEINVHPRSELLCGQAEEVFAGEKEVPWDEVSMEELHQLQNYPILRDSGGFLTRLRAMTSADLYPPRLWTKRLIHALADLKGGELAGLETAVRRGRMLEAHVALGTVVPALLRVAFLINRQYYPWRTYLLHFLKDISAGQTELLAEFETACTDDDWHRKSAAVTRIVRILTEQILDSGMMSADMLEYLFDAKSGEAWQNPNWREEPDRRRRWAKEAGYDWLDGWIWGWWGWTGKNAEPHAAADAYKPPR